MSINANNNLDIREQHELSEQPLALESLDEQEFADLMGETIPPELELLTFQKQQLKTALDKSDQERQRFLAERKELTKGPYIKQEKQLLAVLTKPFEHARDLKNNFFTYCSTKITQCDNQYRYIRNKLLPNANPQQKIIYERACTALEDMKGKWEDIKNAYLPDLTDLSEILRNKKDKLKYQLMKLDPYKRYEKEDMKKAKQLAEEWPQRSAYNAMKYFSAWPITRADAGKCGITNMHIEENEKILAGLRSTMQTRQKQLNKNQKEYALREEDMEITVPDSADALISLTALTDHLTEEMRTKSIDVTLMTASTL